MWPFSSNQNSKFCHLFMISHKQKNHTTSLIFEEGNRLERHEDMETVLISCFFFLLIEEGHERWEDIARITFHVPRLITTEQNVTLLYLVSRDKVESVIKSMPSNKAPGPDGFTSNFFKACWPILGMDIVEVLEEPRRLKQVWLRINATFITLIPKNK